MLFILVFFSLFIYTLTKGEYSKNTKSELNSTSKKEVVLEKKTDVKKTEEKPVVEEHIVDTPLNEDQIIDYSLKSYKERLKILHDPHFTLEDRIKIFLGPDSENIGLIYYNLETSENININPNNIFMAASVYKVGLSMYTYYLANNGLISLDDVVYYIDIDYEDGSGILQGEDYIGGRSVQELLDLSIIYSDNIAANMLWRHLGGYYNFKYGLYDLIEVECDVVENVLTPDMEFRILKYIYDNKDDTNFSHLIETMKQTISNDRIDKYLPSDKVAHKIGDYDGYSHDVGIVFADSPFILVVFTDCIENSYEKTAQISKAIYEYNTKK